LFLLFVQQTARVKVRYVQYSTSQPQGQPRTVGKVREKEGRGDAPFADSTDRENSRTDNHSSSGSVWENIRALDCPKIQHFFPNTYVLLPSTKRASLFLEKNFNDAQMSTFDVGCCNKRKKCL
jgi:hypothetical protein